MEYSSLYDLIHFLELGTNLHIGVLFFGDYGNEKCILPKAHRIHSSEVCTMFKKHSERSFEKCFKCRNLAINKALSQKTPFSGLCINGVYEYVRPVVTDDTVLAVIFIGNILDREKGYQKILKKSGKPDNFSNTMADGFDAKKCESLGCLIESYIRALLTLPTPETHKTNTLIENIKGYITSNIEFDIETANIASIFHYNEKYLGRLFKKETGLSIKEYVNRQRLLQAKQLLECTNNTILDISSRTGFNNVTYFNRLFRKEFGMTPTEYRSSSKSDDKE